jgi:phospholipase/carboxylesterase
MSELKFYEYGENKNPKYLVIFLHGYGANGQNLLSLSHEFIHVLPEAYFISPNGIDPWEGGFPDSYQWFSLYSGFERKSLIDISVNIIKANDILAKFIKKQLDRFSLTEENLLLVGFSQGGMMSLYQSLISKTKIAGVISYSGKLILPEMLGQKTISKPQICLVHGKEDSVLSFDNFLEAKKLLEEGNFSFENHAIENLDHSIDSTGIRIGKEFIKKLSNKANKVRVL